MVVENVVPGRIVDQLQPRMLSDAAALAERRAWEMRDGSGNGHLQMGAPKNAPWVHPEVVSNPLIEQIATAVVGRSARGGGEFHPLADDGGGPIAWLGFFNGNCATPFAGPHAGNSGYQGLHTGARTGRVPQPPSSFHPDTRLRRRWRVDVLVSRGGGSSRAAVAAPDHLPPHQLLRGGRPPPLVLRCGPALTAS